VFSVIYHDGATIEIALSSLRRRIPLVFQEVKALPYLRIVETIAQSAREGTSPTRGHCGGSRMTAILHVATLLVCIRIRAIALGI